MKKNILGNRFSLIILSILISSALLVLLYGVDKLETEFEENMIEIATKDILAISKNTASSIQETLKDTDNCIKAIQNSQEIQQKIDNKLSILVTKNIKYAYLLYRDTKGTYRFLADGAKSDEKAFINQKLDIQNSRWHKIFETKKPVLIKQPLLRQLSITYLVPLIKNDKVQLILAIDFSVEQQEDINKIIIFVKNMIISIIFIVLLFTIILLVQMFKYFTVKRTAYTDKLTNTYNRNYLQSIEDTINLEEYILSAVDIDYFKKINDQYGHDAGDVILYEVAKTMLQSIRSYEDLLIRYGGEEFVILVKKQKTNENHSLDIMQRVFKNIQEKTFTTPNGKKLQITVSIGINMNPNKSKSFKEAFKLADTALYQAKSDGRNRIKIYSDT